MLNFIKGKKTILLGAVVTLIGSIIGIESSLGKDIFIPDWVWTIAGGLGLAFIRDAINTVANDIKKTIADAAKK